MGTYTAALFSRWALEREAAEAVRRELRRSEARADFSAMDPIAALRVWYRRRERIGLLARTHGENDATRDAWDLFSEYARLFRSLSLVPDGAPFLGPMARALIDRDQARAEEIEYELLRRGWWFTP